MSVPKQKPTITDTPKGVKVGLRDIYAYSNGMVHLVFEDGTEWPMRDDLEAVAWISEHLLRPMQQRARRNTKAGTAAPTADQTRTGRRHGAITFGIDNPFRRRIVVP